MREPDGPPIGDRVDSGTRNSVYDSIPHALDDEIIATGATREESLMVLQVPLLTAEWRTWVDSWRGRAAVQVIGFLRPEGEPWRAASIDLPTRGPEPGIVAASD